MSDRASLLRELLHAERPIDALARELSEFEWDSEEELEVLMPGHVIALLGDYLSGCRAPSEIRRWAETIEGRDDIGFAAESEGVLKNAIFELANPELAHALSPLLARKILADLNR